MLNPGHKSSHILNTSSNLLGICFVVLTSLKVLGKSNNSIIDEITFSAIALFMGSCTLSFLSIRNPAARRSYRLEQAAEIIFLGGLVLLFVTAILFSFNLIR